MSGKSDVSSDSSVDLSRRDFPAMMYYELLPGKIFSRVLSKFKTLFWRSISVEKPLFSGGSES